MTLALGSSGWNQGQWGGEKFAWKLGRVGRKEACVCAHVGGGEVM